jgi:NADP-dependent 3-hydroxy acid dehydrogenase YdfG
MEKIMMAKFPYKTALIVGAGAGISASLARRLSVLGVKVGLAARDVEKLKELADETGAKTFTVDASNPSGVAKLFLDTERLLGEPEVVI